MQRQSQKNNNDSSVCINDTVRTFIGKEGAALTSLTATYPFIARYVYREANFVKADFNASYNTYFSSLKNNFRGMSPYIIGYSLYPFIMAAREGLTRIIAQEITVQGLNGSVTIRPTELKHMITSSLIVGAGSAFIYNPLKAAVVEMQKTVKAVNITGGVMNKYNMFDAMKTIHKQSGIKGFFAGNTFHVARNMIFLTCLLFPFNEFFGSLGMSEEKMSSTEKLAYNVLLKGTCAGVAVGVSMPCDVLNTMRLSDSRRVIYATNYDAMLAAFRAKGSGGFFVGGTYRYAAVFLEFMIFGEASKYYYEQLGRISC